MCVFLGDLWTVLAVHSTVLTYLTAYLNQCVFLGQLQIGKLIRNILTIFCAIVKSDRTEISGFGFFFFVVYENVGGESHQTATIQLRSVP